MPFSLLFTLHLLAVVIWVGGMFFAHIILRPSAIERLEVSCRLPLWGAVFGRFFFWVWLAIGTILSTGYWMVYDVFSTIIGPQAAYIGIMHSSGLIMAGIFTYLFFKPYWHFKAALIEQDYPMAGQALDKIRRLVTINLLLGLATIIIAGAGKYLHF